MSDKKLLRQWRDLDNLFKQWRRLNSKVNKVTAPFRHGNKVPDKAMVELCNAQLDVEKAMNTIKPEAVKKNY